MEQKPELDDFEQRNLALDEYSKRLWQQQVKTEHAEPADDDTYDAGSYSPPLREQPYSPSARDQPYSPQRDQLYYDSCYYGDTDSTLREPFEGQLLKRDIGEETLTLSAKKRRGRPYTEASVKITCLRPGESSLTPLTSNFVQMQEEGLGIPKSEMVHGLRTSSKLPLHWTSEQLRSYITELFPRVQNFRYMKCNKAKGLLPLPDDLSPRDMRDLLGRSGLYIIPIGSLLPKTQTQTQSPAPTGSEEKAITSTETSDSCRSRMRVPGETVVNGDREFRVTLDISGFGPNEVAVKTKGSRVVVQARHGEKEDEYGLIERQFTRQYFLPQDVDPSDVTSSLSQSGTLTLKAPKRTTDEERIVPIQHEIADT